MINPIANKTMIIPCITIIDQINANMFIKIQIKSINLDPITNQGPNQFHT